MNGTNFKKTLLGTGIFLGLISIILIGRVVLAENNSKPSQQASPIHPTFMLLDSEGSNVLDTNNPVSTMQTCGQCHDTDFITNHSFHSDLGMSEQFPAGQSEVARPWETSPGLYGNWNPLTYRYLSPEGDSRIDLDDPGWLNFNSARIAGGGPAESLGLEMNCFLCHLTRPNLTSRTEAIQNGDIAWANTISLLGTGIIEQNGEEISWNQNAFAEDGNLKEEFVTIQDPANDNCALCHGLVHTDIEEPLVLSGCSLTYPHTATTGQVISSQKISFSGMNLKDKSSLTQSWDIHAERGLKCTDCHYSLNNPAYYQEDSEDRPEHLQYDPRRLEIGEYLVKPDHNFARGQSAQSTIAPELKGSMRRCEACHNPQIHADWLPYVDRHMDELACESCHTPKLFAPAVQAYDWTVLQDNGQPLTQCRGTIQDIETGDELIEGFQPVLLQRTDIDGEKMLAPYNLVSSWFWIYDDPNGVRPVRLEDLQKAWLSGNGYAPDILETFDANNNGQLSESELKIDSEAKEILITTKLESLGLSNPRITGEVQPYSINHNVTGGEWATQDCQACHKDQSRLSEPITLSEYTPGGVMPEFVKDTNTTPTTGISDENGQLVFEPETSEYGLYVFGHDRVVWVDIFGALFFVGVLSGVLIHGGMRFYQSLKTPRQKKETKEVYMYHVYERFWHWMQTFVIVILIFTGLIIHRPDIFGWLNFRYMVTIHNISAAILLINAALSLFYHLASGEIKQFIPRPYGFIDQAIVQAKYYMKGIFKGGFHPFEKTPEKKMNPLQQATYFAILNILLPLQILTGALMWGVQRWPEIAGTLGGLPFLAPFHSLVAWTFASFIVGHVYLTTTGYEPLSGMKAMVTGWEEVETHGNQNADLDVPLDESGILNDDSDTAVQGAAAD